MDPIAAAPAPAVAPVVEAVAAPEYPSEKQQQPTAVPMMSVTSVIDPLNGLNLKKDALGQREWSYNIFDCFATPGLCLMAHCLPCVAHGQSEQKATSMATTGQVLENPSFVSASCLLYACFPAPVQYCFRRGLRERHGISGNVGTDLFTTFCCIGCGIVQEAREVLEEEAARIAMNKQVV